ncbi:MAG: bifunctional diaminohydroxyphosphoribosylaminopyrimidine deaminase/5-amino-6-(5-phosphoribosylamino)uracil reductase RibD [Alphaproteobacteria bacterium]|nr:bifunctional diaminohydroxyphosphoribosylaminopyrimidine deaminase/5-amino-6-(5-phosphoribosylamino)uracil reductase RibD [Alphaproteobacteria bacterium]
MSTLTAEAAMHHALQLARRGLGTTAENPAVGCVIVKDGCIVGRGFTWPGGRPHAETVALKQAGERAEGAEVFVTLEPCTHHGQTPPCVDALIAAKVVKVHIAINDPNPAVNGAGIARLQQAGVATAFGLCLPEALFLNQGYVMRRIAERPLVAAKIVLTQDGRMALTNGASQWITAAPARARAQGIRATFDCLLSGIGTVLIDNPSFTCRLPGLEDRLPLRAICDSLLRIPPDCQLVQQAAQHPLRVYCHEDCAKGEKAHHLRNIGVQVQGVAMNDAWLDLFAVLHDLAENGINRVLLEAGEILTTSALQQNLIDRLFLFRGNCLFGGDAQAGVGNLGLKRISHAPKLHRISEEAVGADRLEIFLMEYPNG